MTPRLSIIIPSFNRIMETRRAIASACASAPDNAEILLVDDGSSTPFVDVSNDPRVRLLRHSENRGAAAARNTGLEAARGEWAAFLDSDDVWLEGSFATRWAEACAANAPSLTVFVAGFRTRDVRTGHAKERVPVSSRNLLWFASGCWFCPGSTALFRREPVLRAVGLQDTELRRLEDLDWFLRLALAGGGVEASPLVAAQVNRSPRSALGIVLRSRDTLLNKYSAPPLKLERAQFARLSAYLDIECAASARAEGRPLETCVHLARSWLSAPRMRLHLEQFWT